MSVFLLFTTCRFPPGVSVSPACSLPLTYIHPLCHYSSFLSYSVLLFLAFSFLSSSLWPATERIINEHHKALSLLAVLWWVCQLCHSEQNHAALLFDPHFKEGSPLFSAQRSNCVLIWMGQNPQLLQNQPVQDTDSTERGHVQITALEEFNFYAAQWLISWFS